MIDVVQYRIKIGTHYQEGRKVKFKSFSSCCYKNRNNGGRLHILAIIVLIFALSTHNIHQCLYTSEFHGYCTSSRVGRNQQSPATCCAFSNLSSSLKSQSRVTAREFSKEGLHKKPKRENKVNFLARYKYGNKQTQRGITN